MAHIHRLLQGLVALLVMTILGACGGGGGDGAPPPPANRAPVASAGPAQSVVAGTLVTLDGSASTDPDKDPLSYAWTLARPAGSTATLSAGSTARPTFTCSVFFPCRILNIYINFEARGDRKYRSANCTSTAVEVSSTFRTTCTTCTTFTCSIIQNQNCWELYIWVTINKHI